MLFKDIPYVRPDLGRWAEETRAYVKALSDASSYEELRRLYIEHDQAGRSIRTASSIAHIRNTINTADPFYEEEMKYLNTEMPRLDLIEKEADLALLNSPFRDAFAAEFGPNLIQQLEAGQKLSSEAILEDRVLEANLTVQYSKTAAGCKAVFRGEECNFYGLLKHMQSTDRQERKEAMQVWADLYAKTADKLDSIYDQLIQVRCRMAEKLGFSSFTEMAYLQRGRFDYTPEDAANFRRQVLEEIVPVAARIFARQKEALGIDQLHWYDEALSDPKGNPVPHGTRDELVAAAQQMYRELSPETGEFFDKMVANELFDLETKPNKRVGGYCTFLPSLEMPFIFSNFNGTAADAEVLTHEAGHAFQSYLSCRELPLSEQIWAVSEVAEIHSMSMEYWTYPWMDRFFKEDADRYRYDHLSSSLSNIPYLVSVDEFQHEVYANPTMTAKERRAVWHRIEQKYMPWRDYDGNAFLEEGGFWMQKQHIFLYPFYYIEYALAIMGAFEFYTKQKKDRKAAWEDYMRLCRAGGSKGYFDLMKLANLSIPLQDGGVRNAIAGVVEELEQH